MFEPLEILPREESQNRLSRLQANVEEFVPQAEGVLVFSRMNIYYFSGSWVNGALYIPVHGDSVLMVRRGLGRAGLESGLKNKVSFRSFRDMPGILREFGCEPKGPVAAEKSGLPWSLAESVQKWLPEVDFLAADMALSATRAVKTDWELEKLVLAGERHHEALHRIMPGRIRPGMSEREIAVTLWNVCFELGHSGHMRMQNFGEEIFLGHVSAGDSANYPSTFNGPVGVRGEHPAELHMGYAGKIWADNEPLVIDIGFCVEGYHTDKTQVYLPSGWEPPSEFVRAQECCRDIQEALAEMLRPGETPARLYEKAQDMAEKAGFSDGFMGLGQNKVPFVGHGIGLAIDEWPVIAKSFRQPFAENTCMALEPKIGVQGVGMAGVENTFQVTPEGGRPLTGTEFEPVEVGDS
ncbi:MAG: M24 family metallopeptidase [Desulfonatronovibrionaceae bacterium]